MATSAAPQRRYRAPCPGCGAPVDFFSAQSTHAVCGYCQSSVVRQGDVLARIGKMAEVFDDHSPLQLMASGQFKGVAFTVVGRLQYQYGDFSAEAQGEAGSWTEWVCVLADGQPALLSEDNGAYIFGQPVALALPKAPAKNFALGSTQSFNNRAYTVTSNRVVSLKSAQGELPRLPNPGTPFEMVELRANDGEVLALDYAPTLLGQAPSASTGHSVNLADLALKGLKDESVSEQKGRQFACPSCGGSVQPLLVTSKSITCQQCKSLIDLDSGIGGELKAAVQDEPVQPTIPVGTTGQLQGDSWQVVGYQHRMGKDPDDPDESFGWEEYLLYNQKKGFQFLVDSEEGWSLVKPTTGAPTTSAGGRQANYLGKTFALKYSYLATTNYVVGEFYWRVRRGQATQNRDYALGTQLLSCEQDGQEITWSYGGSVPSILVGQAFGLTNNPAFSTRQDASPLAGGSGSGLSLKGWLIVIIILFMLFAIIGSCSDKCDPRYENCNRSSSGGSWGGFSSGGGHK